MKKAIILTLCMLFCLAGQGEPVATAATAAPNGASGAPGVQQMLQAPSEAELATVIVTLRDQANLRTIRDPQRSMRRRQLLQALRNKADATQAPLRRLLETRRQQGKVSAVTAFWVFNGLAVTATQEVIDELAAHPAVASIAPNTTFFAPAVVPMQPDAPAEPNITLANAPALWDLGVHGQGVVVANLDTGVDLYHPDLVDKWRGGANSWFDPYGQHTLPADMAGSASGHGTWTMGVMVGGSAGGTAVGMAPAAQWIAAKIFNNQGVATAAGIHAAFQWLLDPDGDPQTDDAPHVVNNSWTFQNTGCNLEFQLDLQALRTAGIVPVFAAGNGGPGSETSYSPANYPEALAVGAINNNSAIYNNSSRGPSACGEAPAIYPELVAPGVNVKTTDLYGFYASRTGTSLAAPHVAGALALLLSAYPNLTADEQTSALLTTAVDLGDSGADNTFGYGRLDSLAAYQSLLPANQPPVVHAGPDQTITLPDAATLNGTASDDGLPAPPNLTVTWSQVDGPGAVTFADPYAAATIATFVTDGVYTLRLTADDGALSASDDVAITVNPAPPSANALYVSAAANGKVNGLAFRNEDILLFDPTDNTWALYFDGSNVGLGGKGTNGKDVNLDAFSLLADGRILLSLSEPVNLPGVGLVDDSDIVVFTPTSLGFNNTAGSYTLYFSGASAGLTTDAEDINAIAFTPDGRLVVSTLGNFSVPGAGGSTLTGRKEDLIVWNAASSTWEMYFDGSDVWVSGPDVFAATITADGAIYLAPGRNFTVSGGVSGQQDDIIVCEPASLGNNTSCAFTFFWDGAAYGFGYKLNGLDLAPAPVFASAVTGIAITDYTDEESDVLDDEAIDEPEAAEAEEDEAQQHRIHLPVIQR